MLVNQSLTGPYNPSLGLAPSITLHARACQCYGCAPSVSRPTTSGSFPCSSLILSWSDWVRAGKPATSDDYWEFVRGSVPPSDPAHFQPKS